MRAGGAALLLAALMLVPMPAAADPQITILDFDALPGWPEDRLDRALTVFAETCDGLSGPDWRSVCNLARSNPDPRDFFELLFRPVLIEDGDPALFTGYYEPELHGALTPDDTYRFPIYSLPPDFTPGEPYPTRDEIEREKLLEGKGLEIAWVDDAVDAFFLQVQGSGRIVLPDGKVIRVGYAGKNGQPYRSIGQELVRRGVYKAHQVSASVIRNWVRRNGEEGLELLHHNPSFVFFRKVDEVPPEKGPLGAMNRSITAMRSIAVDPAFVPLGAPVWIDKGGEVPMRRLMVAQDTGSAIKGAQRADIFFGTGAEAGRKAGRVRDPGRLVVLLPIQRAYALAEDWAPVR
ncbi:murein transglycosylase A [Frigidibacter sp. ROC022]|uniref:murein transglycosylase A n=1 Tax=Frigidibacter sp. ROC022 TaxID=2971796 RepID=UPI00215AD076|nr:MltA domain-containing protein [Frigidibacter sp. ROC022]MCR8724481.1 MltA domain-containing protein [Frigidibacter sp. ROC022]